jgi:hypothetical protein
MVTEQSSGQRWSECDAPAAEQLDAFTFAVRLAALPSNVKSGEGALDLAVATGRHHRVAARALSLSSFFRGLRVEISRHPALSAPFLFPLPLLSHIT